MKTILVLLSAVLLSGIATTTQAQNTTQHFPQSQTKPSPDYIMMKNGNMMMSKRGKMMP